MLPRMSRGTNPRATGTAIRALKVFLVPWRMSAPPLNADTRVTHRHVCSAIDRGSEKEGRTALGQLVCAH